MSWCDASRLWLHSHGTVEATGSCRENYGPKDIISSAETGYWLLDQLAFTIGCRSRLARVRGRAEQGEAPMRTTTDQGPELLSRVLHEAGASISALARRRSRLEACGESDFMIALPFLLLQWVQLSQLLKNGEGRATRPCPSNIGFCSRCWLLMDEPTVLNFEEALVPRNVMATMQTTAISATSRAYSTSEAPRSSSKGTEPGGEELVGGDHVFRCSLLLTTAPGSGCWLPVPPTIGATGPGVNGHLVTIFLALSSPSTIVTSSSR